jgi:hypothetical protein
MHLHDFQPISWQNLKTFPVNFTKSDNRRFLTQIEKKEIDFSIYLIQTAQKYRKKERISSNTLGVSTIAKFLELLAAGL